MPELEALLDRFHRAHTQPLGISVDSIHSHANWARKLGGVSFPLLADFHPKGEVARAYGLYLEDKGITDRATVFIDADGTVRHADSVTPSGKRDMSELAATAERIDAEYGSPLPAPAPAAGLEDRPVLFVKNRCSFSDSVLLARDNLHLGDRLPVRNVSEDPSAREELKRLSGKETAPCLVVGGAPMFESKDIVRYLVERHTPQWR